jgi:hypothetical protein
MIKRLFAFCLAVVATFCLVTNVTFADDTKTESAKNKVKAAAAKVKAARKEAKQARADRAEAKLEKKDSVKVEKVAADESVEAAPCDGTRHQRRARPRLFRDFRFPRIELPRIEWSRLSCRLFDREEEVVTPTEPVAVEGKVVHERSYTVCRADGKTVRNVKYVKFPGRFLLKRIVSTEEADVQVTP